MPALNFSLFVILFFEQPELFLRIRPGKKEMVIEKLQTAALPFELLHDDCIALPNSTKLENILEIDKEVIIQDHNSQQVLNSIKDQGSSIKEPRPIGSSGRAISVWDCCAASGGKSILAYDILEGKIELTVSDIRESILSNLKKDSP